MCPCSALSSPCRAEAEGNETQEGHVHLRPERKKGIPRLMKKFRMNKALFAIGQLRVTTTPEDEFTAEIRTKERLIQRAPDGVIVQRGGQAIELVTKGGVNRDVPGSRLAKCFMRFFGGPFLAAAGADRMKQGDNETTAFSVRENAEEVVFYYEAKKTAERRKKA